MFALARIHLAAFKEISKFMIASFDHFDRQAKSKVLWSCDNLVSLGNLDKMEYSNFFRTCIILLNSRVVSLGSQKV